MNIGTWLFTLINGDFVGEDEFGNRYYRTRKKPRYGREQRWVVYKGVVEASKVPPEWHAWLHHMVSDPLTESAARARPWQREHLPNLTGTPFAYRPRGHELRGGQRAPATGDYEAWTPE